MSRVKPSLVLLPLGQRHIHPQPAPLACVYKGSTMEPHQRDWYTYDWPVHVVCRLSSEPLDYVDLPAFVGDASPIIQEAINLGVVEP